MPEVRAGSWGLQGFLSCSSGRNTGSQPGSPHRCSGCLEPPPGYRSEHPSCQCAPQQVTQTPRLEWRKVRFPALGSATGPAPHLHLLNCSPVIWIESFQESPATTHPDPTLAHLHGSPGTGRAGTAASCVSSLRCLRSVKGVMAVGGLSSRSFHALSFLDECLTATQRCHPSPLISGPGPSRTREKHFVPHPCPWEFPAGTGLFVIIFWLGFGVHPAVLGAHSWL